jgi:hypothetical protein
MAEMARLGWMIVTEFVKKPVFCGKMGEKMGKILLERSVPADFPPQIGPE